jgi:hypothetical protein
MLDELQAKVRLAKSTISRWRQAREDILKQPSKKAQRKMISDIAKKFKPCRPKYMQKCIETSGSMTHELDRRRAMGKSKDNAKRHYIQVSW